ncbi:MAG: calcium/sodium antiporter [Calditrichaeota bacterium]|nr:calcium/sodium antiporter [Calditrichota bacterium]
MDLLMWTGIFIVSLAGLIKASDYFTASAEQIGLMIGMSPYVVGATIVAVGTSMPELVSSMFAVYQGSSEIVVGNVIGSNVANILLILAMGAIFSKSVLTVDVKAMYADNLMLIASAMFFGITIIDRLFTRGEAGFFLLAMILVVVYTIRKERSNKAARLRTGNEPPKRIRPFLILIISALGVFFGAKFTILAIINIAPLLNIGAEVIAVSAVAIGTSLPELAVTMAAVRKNQTEIIIGNVLGSNIFNTFAVMGFSGLLGDLAVPDDLIFIGMPVMVAASLLLIFILRDSKVNKWEGWLFLLFYGYFILKIFNLV